MAVGDPTGDDLCSGTTNGDTLPQSPTWEEREITFGAGYALVSGVQYAIVVRAPSASSVATLNWNRSNANPYTNGAQYYSTNSGTSWTVYTDNDVWFKTKSNGTVKEDGSFSKTTWYGCGKTTWLSQTFIASSSYTVTSVILKLNRAFGLLPGTITVSIKNVEGSGPQKVTTPSPIDTYDTMTLDWQAFSWAAGGTPPDEEVYNIYLGTDPDNLALIALESPLTSITQAYLDFVLGNGEYNTDYYWRVDAYWPSTDQTATGDTWSFSTIVFKTPAVGPRGFGGGSGEADGFGGGAIADGQANIKTRLVAFTRNKVFYEDT